MGRAGGGGTPVSRVWVSVRGMAGGRGWPATLLTSTDKGVAEWSIRPKVVCGMLSTSWGGRSSGTHSVFEGFGVGMGLGS